MKKENFVFGKMNYIFMIAGLLIIALGFLIMTMETAEYGFGSLGLTVGPVTIFIGIATEFVAIFYKPKSKGE